MLDQIKMNQNLSMTLQRNKSYDSDFFKTLSLEGK